MHRLFTKYFFLICLLIIGILPMQKALNNLSTADIKIGQYHGVKVEEINDLKAANFGFNSKTKMVEIKKAYFDQIKTNNANDIVFAGNKIVYINAHEKANLKVADLFKNSADNMTLYNIYSADTKRPDDYIAISMPRGLAGIQVVDQINEHPLNIKSETRSLFKNQAVFLDTNQEQSDKISGFYIFNTYGQTNVIMWKIYTLVDGMLGTNGIQVIRDILIIMLVIFCGWYLAKNPFKGENRCLELVFIFLLTNILIILSQKYFILTKSFILWINILFIPMYLRILLKKQDY